MSFPHFKENKMGSKKIFEVFLKGLVILLDIVLAMIAFLMAICDLMVVFSPESLALPVRMILAKIYGVILALKILCTKLLKALGSKHSRGK